MKPEDVLREQRRAERTKLEDALWWQMVADSLPLPVREYGFHAKRKWRFDFAWPERLLAVEVDGGEWVQGRHWRPKGVSDDREKSLAADRLGWAVLHFTGTQVKSGSALKVIAGALAGGVE
jgi:very-short-patch-repair endonuclease